MKTNWHLVPLANLVTFKGGGTPSKKNSAYWGGDISWVSPKDMKAATVSSSIDSITLEGVSNSAVSLIPPNSLLIVVRSGILSRTIPVALASKELTINQDLKALIPGDHILPPFLYYFFKLSQSDLLGRVTRSATVHRLQIDTLKSLMVPLPKLKEQKRIVAILDDAFAGIDTAIANTEKNCANARELFESYLDRAFAPKKKGWPKQKISDCATLVSTGPFGSLLHKSDYVSDGVPLVNPINISGADIRPDDKKRVDDSTKARLKAYVLRKGDVIVARRGQIGRCAVIDYKQDGWLCGTGCFFVRPSPNINSKFIAYSIKAFRYRGQLERSASGATMKNLSNKALANLEIGVPNKKIQDSVVEHVESVLAQKHEIEEIYQRKTLAFSELKQALLNRAFSGELTARDAEDEVQEATA